MKRGLITWDKAELSPAAFDSRLSRVREVLAERNLSALVVYSDVWRSNQGRYFSNFMPYWNRALLVIAAEGGVGVAHASPSLLCALSPRVYPWIRSATNIDEIRPSPNLPQQLLTMCTEKGWKKIGVLDLDAMPQDVYAPVAKGLDSVADIPWSVVHNAPDEAELSMYRRGAALAREVLDQEIASTDGGIDHAFVGRLEPRLRLVGAEDLVVLLTNGQTPPKPASGITLDKAFSVTLAFEYRGHWIKVSRTGAPPDVLTSLKGFFRNSMETNSFGDSAPGMYLENLSGPYPWESCNAAELTVGSLFAAHVETQVDGRRLFYGDTCIRSTNGAELL
jgi:hypothetical protein